MSISTVQMLMSCCLFACVLPTESIQYSDKPSPGAKMVLAGCIMGGQRPGPPSTCGKLMVAEREIDHLPICGCQPPPLWRNLGPMAMPPAGYRLGTGNFIRLAMGVARVGN